jgi:AAA+ ATPase superfamily predicted ATPase
MPNPFASGSPVQGDQFGDRDDEARSLVGRMTAGQNVFISSPRRFGKTSLLLRASSLGHERDVSTVKFCKLVRPL